MKQWLYWKEEDLNFWDNEIGTGIIGVHSGFLIGRYRFKKDDTPYNFGDDYR